MKKTFFILCLLSIGSLVVPQALYSQDQQDSSHVTLPPNTNPERLLPVSDLELSGKSALADLETRSTVHVPDTADEERIELNLEDTDLQNFVHQIEQLFNITFVPDDIVEPMLSGKKQIKGNKITFRSNTPMTKEGVWNFFSTALDIAGLAIVPMGEKSFYRITTTADARKSAIPSYIGIDPAKLPDHDQIIRYVYFIANDALPAIKSVVDSLRSNSSSFLFLNDLKAFVLTDKAYNIKALMKVVTEMDQNTIPEAMSVMILREADATEVKALYNAITDTDNKTITARLFPANKQPTSLYLPENVRIIAEPRRNALILLGPIDAIEKIETFIRQNLDKSIDKPYSPLRTHNLKFADAKTVARVMNDLVKFGQTTIAGKSGGVRGEDKYLRNMSFIAEPATNQLIINGYEEDYLQVKEIIEQLDEQQPQVAIEVLILTVQLQDRKKLGIQMRSKDKQHVSDKAFGTNGMFGDSVKFQTSGICLGPNNAPQGIVTRDQGQGVERLLGDLINLVTGSTAGNTVVTLGSDILGVWGVFSALQTIGNTQVVANPFLVATNKKKAEISIGEVRRVVSGTVISGGTETQSFTNKPANLTVNVTPQINSDGMIVLDLDVSIDTFLNPNDPNSATTATRKIDTTTIVADNEVLALGGLIRNTANNNASKTPGLSEIPVLGWFFKNRDKQNIRDNLLILISTRIIKPEDTQDTHSFTQERIDTYQDTLEEMSDISTKRDPIHKIFFEDTNKDIEKAVDKLFFERRSDQQAAMKTKTKKHRARRGGKKKEVTPAQQEKAESTSLLSGSKKIEFSKNDAKSQDLTTPRKNRSLTQLFSTQHKESAE